MPLGTIDRTPPPFFRQGPSALTKLVFFSALAIFLMVADARFHIVSPVRQTLAVTLLPVQRAVAVPLALLQRGEDYAGGLARALESERNAQAARTALAERALRSEILSAENTRLRALLDLRAATPVKSQPAEVLYEAADPFSRKVVIDRGSADGLVVGSPVINESGVLGQVTRAYPRTSEVTLLADKDAAIPVINVRTQQRGAALGGSPGLELRFTSTTADVETGDRLQTSGLDGVYPPGLPVARVTHVERRAESGFARIRLEPEAPTDGVRHVLVLEPMAAQMPVRPAVQPEVEAPRTERHLKAPGRRGASAP